MSIMNDLDLKLKELENLMDQISETVQSVCELLSNNKDEAPSADEQSQRNPIENKATVCKMLVKKVPKATLNKLKNCFISLGLRSSLM